MTTLADHRARDTTTGSAWIEGLRWLAVLPLALFAFGVTQNLVHALLGWSDVLREIITPFITAAVFLLVGSIVAPRFKVQTAVVMIGISVLAFLAVVVAWLAGAQFSWVSVRTPGDPLVSIGTLTGILGWVYAVYWIRKDAASRAA